jgi:hypothetical protein
VDHYEPFLKAEIDRLVPERLAPEKPPLEIWYLLISPTFCRSIPFILWKGNIQDGQMCACVRLLFFLEQRQPCPALN